MPTFKVFADVVSELPELGSSDVVFVHEASVQSMIAAASTATMIFLIVFFIFFSTFH